MSEVPLYADFDLQPIVAWWCTCSYGGLLAMQGDESRAKIDLTGSELTVGGASQLLSRTEIDFTGGD